jgi:hypothetical protein
LTLKGAMNRRLKKLHTRTKEEVKEVAILYYVRFVNACCLREECLRYPGIYIRRLDIIVLWYHEIVSASEIRLRGQEDVVVWGPHSGTAVNQWTNSRPPHDHRPRQEVCRYVETSDAYPTVSCHTGLIIIITDAEMSD